MFSGIITAKEKPTKIFKTKMSMELIFPIPKEWNIMEGESININGICSTIKEVSNNCFTVYYMPETIKRTNISVTHDKSFFNLERSLTLQSLIGGHLVSGHVDTTAKVTDVKDSGDSRVLTFSIDKAFTKYMIYKGSISVNGVSLTIVSVKENTFTVSLIPYTLEHTNLGELQKGDMVNIEVDMTAKYIEKLLHSRP